MTTATQSFWRDGNRVPITGHGLVVRKDVTFTGEAATVVVPLFRVTGLVEVLKIGGGVTTALENHTDAHLRINDQTNTDQVLSKTTTLTLTNATVGAAIYKDGLAAAVLNYMDSGAGAISEPAVADEQSFSPVLINQITTDANTDIEYVYTTSDDPTTGAMSFYVGFLPLSPDGNIEAV